MNTNSLPRVSRSNDPESSKLAEDEINRTGARERQLDWTYSVVEENPGLTCRELAAVIGGLDKYKVAYYQQKLHRRLSDLRALGRIIGEEQRICRVSNRRAIIWTISGLQQPLFGEDK